MMVVEVTEELLKTTQNHLPKGDTEDGSETYNLVLVVLLSELMISPLSPSIAESHKVTVGSYIFGKALYDNDGAVCLRSCCPHL